MGASYCPACYGRKIYCRSCRTTHCGCSWSKCPKPRAPRGMRRIGDKLYDNDCDKCHKRTGDLVSQEVMPAQPGMDIMKPWVHRYFLCRYCRAAETKRKKRGRSGLPTTVIAFKLDADLLKEVER